VNEIAEHQSGAHASRSTYWLVALILAIITMLEVAVFYIPFLRTAIAPMPGGRRGHHLGAHAAVWGAEADGAGLIDGVRLAPR
jgi:hypothetical protein